MTNAQRDNCNCELCVLTFVYAYMHTPIESLLNQNHSRYIAVIRTQYGIFKLHFAQH